MPTWKKTYSASPVDSTGNSPMQTPWISHSWRRIPFRTLLCILSGFLGMIVALCVSIEANGSRVDHWNISPTVLVSICATFSVMMVRAAFRSGADLFWWSTLCSERGVSLRALHVIWDLAHNSTSLATPSSLKANLQPLLRCAGSVVLLMGVVGPFLQRAITVELGVENTSGNVHLPIRRQPMWNLTTLGSPEAGWQWNIQPYENVFAEVAKEYQQRQPIALRQADVCPANSTCTTSVVVAGFHRACNESLVPSANISSLQSARVITLGQDRTYYCTTTGALSEGYCSNFETRFQLDLNQVYPPPKESPDPLSNPWLLPEDLGLDNDLPPAVLNYTSYTRQDTLTNLISVRNCAFTTAFVALPIEITDRNKVTLQHSQSDGSQDRGVDPSSLGLIGKERLVEVIPCPFTWAPNHSILDGFVQITMDLYGGLTLLDHNEGGTQVVQGLGARQFVNQSSFIKTNERGQVGIDVAYVDPIDVVTNTLDEISLRYAVKSLPLDQASRDALENYMYPSGPTAAQDNRRPALTSMETAIQPAQDAEIRISSTVALYKVNYVYTIVAVGCVSVANILIFALLRSWTQLGREVSMSPLEIAKAFDAPILQDVKSNSAGFQISEDLHTLAVRYGVSKNGVSLRPRLHLPSKPLRFQKGNDVESTGDPNIGSVVNETTELAHCDELATDFQASPRLLIDLLDRVDTPGRKIT